jgi:protein-S-isoprenylcysteine O-methyltransferase Ste14
MLVAYLAQSSFYPLKALASGPSLLGISSGTWVAVGLWSLMTHIVLRRMKGEEVMLSEHFGKEWDEYASKRWRLIPFLY